MHDQSKELFEILKQNGKPTGRLKPRGEVHRDGDLHGSIHVWVLDGNEVLLQKRSADKDVFPGYIDASCTGHIDPGETPVEAALRELSEELGICAEEKDLRFILRQRVTNRIPPLFNRELDYVFLLEKPLDRETVTYQQDEIETIFFLDADILSQMLRDNEPFFCIIPKEWRKLCKMRKKSH
ncbi:MAG: NUDIX domain-containing protein [Christensenellaceae bacterium]|nr:NUDIX domain-containing protein [Christensenellaceae bacterium]